MHVKMRKIMVIILREFKRKTWKREDYSI